jgi:hypothetical protein
MLLRSECTTVSKNACNRRNIYFTTAKHAQNGIWKSISIYLFLYKKTNCIIIIIIITPIPVQKTENTAVGIRHADHVAASIRKSWY